jgi:hypothetical protein
VKAVVKEQESTRNQRHNNHKSLIEIYTANLGSVQA